jgi:hypothetical protein
MRSRKFSAAIRDALTAMSALTDWVRQIEQTLKHLFRIARQSLREKGPRFLCVAITSNLAGMGLGYLFFKHLTSLLSISIVSVASGILHVLITYSSHYFFTFRRPGRYFQGLWKVYVTAWMGMLIASLMNQFFIGSLQMPYFLAQCLIFCFGASYSLLVNFLFVFRGRSP